jgi:hypothetical protein
MSSHAVNIAAPKQLSPELWTIILSHVSPKDAARCRPLNRSFRSIVDHYMNTSWREHLSPWLGQSKSKRGALLLETLLYKGLHIPPSIIYGALVDKSPKCFPPMAYLAPILERTMHVATDRVPKDVPELIHALSDDTLVCSEATVQAYVSRLLQGANHEAIPKAQQDDLQQCVRQWPGAEDVSTYPTWATYQTDHPTAR